MSNAVSNLRRLKYAATINDEALSEETDPDFELQYVDIGNVDSSGRVDQIATHRFEAAPSRARRIVRHGDVIISTVRTYLQAIAAIEKPAENLIVSTGFAVVRPQKGKLDANFCKYAVREPRFINEVITRSVGVSYPAINASDLGDISISLPSLAEQRAIAGYLDRETGRLDALVVAKERWLELLAEKRSALITHAVTRGLNPAAPLRDSGFPWLGQVPKHWRVERLKFHLHRMEQGWSPQCENNPADAGEWGVLKAGCVNDLEFDPNENKKLPDELSPALEYEIEPGDVLMSRANTTELLGSTALVRAVRPRLLLCDKLYRLAVNETRLDKEFLVTFLRSSAGRFGFEREATGASNSMQNIGQDSVRNIWVSVPPLAEQRAIVAHIATATAKLDGLRAAAERTIALLKERRAALIAAAVTGKIAVPTRPASGKTGASYEN